MSDANDIDTEDDERTGTVEAASGEDAVPDDTAATPDGARGLWDGDTGTLAFDTRRVLVQLLSGPSLDAERHRLLWPVLIRDESAVRSHLSDLFLELLIDPDLGVAFVRQVETDELDIPVLLRRQQLTFVDSVVLLHLRQLLIRAQSAGERAVVSTAEVVDAASVYARSDSTDHAGFAKRVAASVEKLKKASLLRKLRGSDERFEIAPTLKLLFSAERVEALLREYRVLGGEDVGDHDDAASASDVASAAPGDDAP